MGHHAPARALTYRADRRCCWILIGQSFSLSNLAH
jgi:hypothetical protein